MSESRLQHDQFQLIRASWAPIYLEPIRHSGERITIANALVTDDKETIKVVSTLNPAVLRCLFGNRESEILNLADLINTQLKAHLLTDPNINSWQPLMTGVYPGKIRTIKDYTIEKMLHKMVSATSSLGVTEETEAESLKSDKWASQIKSVVKKAAPHLAKNFNRDLMHNGTKIATISYVGSKIAANFTEIKPRVNSRNAVDQSIRQITNMRTYAARCDLFKTQDWTGLVVHKQKNISMTLQQERSAYAHHEKILTLCEDLDVPVKIFDSTDQAVEFILSDAK